MSARSGRVITADLLRIMRDPMLVVLACVPLALAVVAQLAAPSLLPLLPRSLDARVLTALLLVLTPLMFGFVYGLVLLDERDEGVLHVIAVTPTGRGGFLLLRMTAPAAWTAAAGAAIVLLGRGYGPPSTSALLDALLHALAVGLLAGLQTPMLALFLAAFAGDKVQGMALAKVGSLIIGLGAVAPLAPLPWRWLAAPTPHFWLIELLLTPPRSAAFALRVLVALAVHVGIVWLLSRAYSRRAG
jgi:fluoroquinolone transport system permease protein